MKPLPLLLLAAEAGEKLSFQESYRLYVELLRATEYAKRLLKVAKRELGTH